MNPPKISMFVAAFIAKTTNQQTGKKESFHTPFLFPFPLRSSSFS